MAGLFVRVATQSLLRSRSGHHFHVVTFAAMRLTLPSPGTANQTRDFDSPPDLRLIISNPRYPRSSR